MKKLLIGLGVVLILVVGAVLVVPSFIDWSGYRSEIAQKVKEATGRNLLIGGDIAFSLVPSPILRVSDIRLANAEHASTQDMVSIRQLDVKVALLPLLRGVVHVQSLRLIEPVIHLEMLENGKGNWILGGANQENGNIETQPQTGAPLFEDEMSSKDGALPVQIDDFFIEKGQIVYVDKASGVSEQVLDINSRLAIAGLNGPFEAAGTMNVHNIPVGFEGSVGQIVHGRTASFASALTFAHGATMGKLSGTFVNLSEGPKVKGKVELKGASLAGFISAFNNQAKLHGGLDRKFSLEGEVVVGSKGLSFGKEGLSVEIGEDKGHVLFDFALTEKKILEANASFSKVNGDAWLDAKPFVYVEPEPLPLVIELSKPVAQGTGGRVSAALSTPQKKSAPKENIKKAELPKLPKDITAKISMGIEALIIKGEPLRQVHASISLSEGELALERLSALLPGAGELSLIGVAGEREGKIQFDGSLDFNVAHMRGALRWLDMDVANVPTDRLQQFDLQAQISGNPEELRLYDVVAKLDGSTVTGATTIALRERPSFGASFQLDRLNVDAYAKKVAKTQAQSTLKPANKADDKPAVTTNQKPSPSFVEALGVLEKFDANLVLSLGHLTYENRDIKDISFDATIYNGGLRLRDVGAKNFAGLKVTATGAIKREDNGVMADNLTLSVKGKSLVGAAGVAGLQSIMDWKKFGPVDLKATLNGNVLAPDVDVSANILGGSIIVAGSADLFPQPKLDATLNVQYGDIRTVTKRLALGYQPSGNPGALDLNADVSYTPAQVVVKNLSGQIGKTALVGEATIKQGSRPYIDVALQTGAFRLDPLMPKKAQARAVKKSAKRPSTQGDASTSSSAAPSSAKWSQDKIDLSALGNMDGKVRIQAKALIKEKLTLKNVMLHADLKEGVLDISKADVEAFGGKAALTSQIDVKDKARISSNFSGSGLKLGRVLSQMGSKTSANGGVSFSGQVSTQGQSEADFVSNLNGVVNMGLQKISVGSKSKSGSALDILNLLAVLSGTDPQKGIADVTLKSDITQGVAKLTTATLASNIASGDAGGYVDLPNWMVDVSGNLNVKQNALIGLLAQKAKMKSSYPFSFKGTLDSPNVKLDTGGVSSGGGLVIPLSSHAEKKGYGNIIRGLLGAGGVKIDAPEETQPASVPTTPAADGSMAPPPPPPGGGSSSSGATKPSSIEQQLLQGLGTLLKKR